VRPYSAGEEAHRQELRRKAIVGSGAQVAARLRALAEEYAVDEIAVITWTWDADAQRHSYELLAKEFEMG
jgi:alkanesulfonate monooxygenase SsuD/methylene tetrahydromethanopterin reductase-like flavin-dependent oxidoreductase (luciferase family)